MSASSDPSDVRYTRNNYALTHHGNYDGGMTTSYLQREETRNPSRDMKTANTLMNTKTRCISAIILSASAANTVTKR